MFWSESRFLNDVLCFCFCVAGVRSVCQYSRLQQGLTGLSLLQTSQRWLPKLILHARYSCTHTHTHSHSLTDLSLIKNSLQWIPVWILDHRQCERLSYTKTLNRFESYILLVIITATQIRHLSFAGDNNKDNKLLLANFEVDLNAAR